MVKSLVVEAGVYHSGPVSFSVKGVFDWGQWSEFHTGLAYSRCSVSASCMVPRLVVPPVSPRVQWALNPLQEC